MCCLTTLFIILVSRVGIVYWWLANPASAASIFLRAGAEDSTLTTGRYSLDGSIVNMKSESSEYIGQISGDTLEVEFYSNKTKKGGEHVFTYHPVETNRQDIFNQTGLQQEAPHP